MKRSFCFLLILSLLIIPGCAKDSPEETLSFYYCRKEFAYGTETGIIVPEQRSLPGHEDDLEYLLSLYFVGPQDESCQSPFPKRTQLLAFEQSKDFLLLEITDCSEQLTDAQFSLGCACLAMTCMELTDVKYVTVTSGDAKITLSENSLLLHDSMDLAAISTEEPQ